MYKFVCAAVCALFVCVATTGPATAWDRLVDVKTAKALIAKNSVRIVDIRHRKLGFSRGHIAGSVSLPLWSWRGQRDNPGLPPSDEDLGKMVRAAGLKLDDPIMIVHSGLNATSFASASWVYWVMKSAGFEKIAILDGGIKGWKIAGGKVTKKVTTFKPSATRIAFSDAWLATTQEVADTSNGDTSGALLDARVNQVKSTGTISGAIGYAMSRLMRPSASKPLGPLDTLERLKAADVNWEQESVITFCNNGLLGAATWFMASEIAGIKNVRLYSVSLQGWRKSPQN